MSAWSRHPSLSSIGAISVIALLWLVGDWAGLSAVSGAQGSGQCPNLPTRDYSAPMRNFPPVRSVPEEGRFPFGPPRMRLLSLSEAIQPGEGKLGFIVDLSRVPPLQRRLSWQISLRVDRLSARGTERKIIAERRISPDYSQEIGREEAVLSTGVSGRPGFYRLDISIQNSRGAILGRYSEYVRVIAPAVDVSFILGRQRFHPGDGVSGRIQNRGTVDVAYVPMAKMLEAYGPAGWHSVPKEPRWSGNVTEGLIPAGDVSSCTGIMLPSTLAPGKYRLSQRVTAGGRSLLLRAVFYVG